MNNRPLSAFKYINRSLNKGKITDQRLDDFRAHYFNTRLPQALLYYGYSYERIYEESYLPWLVQCIEDEIRKPKKQREREKFKKLVAYINENYDLVRVRGLKRNLTEGINESLAYINEVRKCKQDRLDHGWSNKDANDYIKESFGFEKIPKWLNQSDKQIKRNLANISHEIALNERAVQQILDFNPLPADQKSDLCVDKKCKMHHNDESFRRKELKRLQNGLFKTGTNKWLDEREFKKYKKAALRAKNEQELKELQTRENEWNYLKDNVSKRDKK